MRSAIIGAALVFAAFAQDEPKQRRMDGDVHRASRPEATDGRVSARALRRLDRLQRRTRLGRLQPNEANRISQKPGLTPVGVSRAVPEDVLAMGQWSTTDEGKRVLRVAIESAGAEALRVRFSNFHVGDGKVWVLGDGESTAGPYSQNGPFQDGAFWSDIVEGDSVTIAYEPSEAISAEVPFEVAELSHRFVTIGAKTKSSDVDVKTAAAASCTLDSTCYSDYQDPASAVALMIFESGGSSYNCSGALISSASQPALPFFLTANHCISNADEAKSLVAIFKYQTPTCNGTVPRLSTLPRVTGASYIAGGAISAGDFTLLQLTSFPKVDVKLLGWYANDIASNQSLTSISHPRGDYKRIAMGQRTRDSNVRFGDGDRMPASRNYQVNWSQGVTQGGSSGSPLLANINGREYVVGTLTGGPDIDEDDSALVCRANNLVATFGRFTTAFTDLGPYLTSADGGASLASQPVFSVAPLTLAPGQTSGRTTITWRVSGVPRVQIRVDSPDGPELTGFEAPSGTAPTGDWVSNGMLFYLQDASSGYSAGASKTIATARALVSAPTVAKSGVISATPNPIFVNPGQTAGSTTLVWRTIGVSQVQIRVNSPTGPTMTGIEPSNGSADTGGWVTDGMVFYLQDASDGSSLGASRTLTSVRVRLNRF
jgi:hypothetical protein